MRYLRFVLFAWAITGLAALVGAVIGGVWLNAGRFIGATIVGTLGVLLAVRLLAARGWLDQNRRRGASIGGLVGLALASPFAQMQLSMPIPLIPVILVGIGMVLAAGRGAVR